MGDGFISNDTAHSLLTSFAFEHPSPIFKVKTMPAMNKIQRAKAAILAEAGCSVCGNHAMIHHCGTGAGGRRDHDKIIALCHLHHQGKEGVHTLGRRVWGEKYGTEEFHLEKSRQLLENRYGNY